MTDPPENTRGAGEAHRSAEVDGLAEELRSAGQLRAIEHITSVLAHDLGSPLNIVLGRAAMIGSGELTPEGQLEAARVIQEQTRAMTSRLREVLALARGRRIQGPPAVVKTCADKVFLLLGREAAKSGVTLQFESSAGLRGRVPEPEIGELELIQVLTAMLSNAIYAMPSGGRIRVVHSATAAGNPPARELVTIEVHDEGVGISPELLGQIFKPFFTTHPHSGAAGLGLSMSRGIIREHHGWIAVDSKVGAGTRFLIHLPPGGH